MKSIRAKGFAINRKNKSTPTPVTQTSLDIKRTAASATDRQRSTIQR